MNRRQRSLAQRFIASTLPKSVVREVAASSSSVAPTDPATAIHARYASVEQRRQQLLVRWGDTEARLARDHDWFALTREQKRELPEARALADVDAELETLGHESSRLVGELPKSAARTLEGIIAKLKIVACEIEPEDYPPAHGALLSALRDLDRLTSTSS